LAPEGQQGMQSFEDRLQQDNESLQEEETEENIYKNPTKIKDFTMPTDPVRMAAMLKGLAKINKKLKHMHHPPIKMIASEAFKKPVYYKDGTVGDEEFTKIEISGRLPSPSDEIGIKQQKPLFWGRNYRGNVKGTPRMEEDGITQKMGKDQDKPVGVKIFARVNHHALTPEEVYKYLKTEPDSSRLKQSILGSLKLKPEQGIPDVLTLSEIMKQDSKVPWYNTITPIGKRRSWDDRFYFSKSKECYKCKNRRERNFTYLAAIIPPAQLVNKTMPQADENGNIVQVPIMIERDMSYGAVGKPRDWQEVNAREVPEELLEDMGNVQQEQLGGNCASSYTEIGIMNSLETEIAKWALTSKEIEENSAENAKEGEAPKERQKGAGGTRGTVPSEAFFTTAIALLREDGIDSDIRGRLPSASSNYVDLMELQNYQIPKDLPPHVRERKELRKERDIKRKTEMIPKITLDDQRIATEAVNWWRQRLNSFGNEGDDNNKVSLSILGTIDISKRNRTKYNQFGFNPNLKSAVEMMQSYLAENEVQLQPYPEEVQTETGEEVVQPGEEVLDDVRNIEQGDSFVSKFKHKRSAPWRSGRGHSHWFSDNMGEEYVVFEKYQKDPATGRVVKEPTMEFNQGEDVYLRGTKGETGRKNTIIDSPKIIDPAKLQEYGAGAEPEITPEAPIDEITPEAPIDDLPIDEGIGDLPIDEGIGGPPEGIGAAPEATAPTQEKATLDNVTERAMYVIDSGTDSRGNPMSVETLIPLYLKQLETRVRGFSVVKDSYEQTLNNINQRGGPTALKRYIEVDMMPKLKDYEIK
jgi:hypothetical protein